MGLDQRFLPVNTAPPDPYVLYVLFCRREHGFPLTKVAWVAAGCPERPRHTWYGFELKDGPEIEQFLLEIVAVCKKHGMVITAEGYDGLQVWKLLPDPTYLDFERILEAEDRTSAGPQARPVKA
jgi:hypothetical protein